MLQPPPNAAYNACLIIVNGVQLQFIEAFIYLGSALSRSTKVDDEVVCWISKANQAFGRLESSRSPPQHQAQDVQSCHLDDAAARSGDLDGVQEAGAEAQQLSPQSPSADTKAEVAGPDPGQGSTRTSKNPGDSRYAETTAIALEQPPRAD
nr:unnamed protein product [Spirometra erinaceieuropaei]